MNIEPWDPRFKQLQASISYLEARLARTSDLLNEAQWRLRFEEKDNEELKAKNAHLEFLLSKVSIYHYLS